MRLLSNAPPLLVGAAGLDAELLSSTAVLLGDVEPGRGGAPARPSHWPASCNSISACAHMHVT
eukprot:1157694-Pelagomonas_calceolata.AAC.11